MPTGEDRDGAASAAKSTKAIAAIQKNKSKGARPKGGVPGGFHIPWLTIVAALSVLALIGVIGWNVYPRYERAAEAERWSPTEENRDPSTQIEGVVTVEYPAGRHIKADQRVAYDQSPPFGGPHDEQWADCTGWVYPQAIRTENAVHSLEHGAVWIAYNPDQVSGAALDTLKAKVENQSYMMMSPYPGLDRPIAVLSWGHQLKVDSADDERIDQFIWALRTNRFTHPEVGATCSVAPGGLFDPDNPPPFDPAPPGPDAVGMNDTENVEVDQAELGLTDPAVVDPAAPAPAPAPANGAQAPAPALAPAPAPAPQPEPAPAPAPEPEPAPAQPTDTPTEPSDTPATPGE